MRERFTPGTRSAECTEGNTTRNMSCCTGVLLQGAYALALEGDKLPVTGTLDTRVRWILVLFFWPTQSSTTRRQVDAPCSSDPSLLTSVDAINSFSFDQTVSSQSIPWEEPAVDFFFLFVT